jgi:hypothetical protein
LTTDDAIRLIDEIPLEKYYDLIINISPLIITDKLEEIPRDFFHQVGKIHVSSHYSEEELRTEESEKDLNKYEEATHHMDMNRLETIVNLNIRQQLPELISLVDEVSLQVFKLGKGGEFNNPIDESLKFEVDNYNGYIKCINNDISIINGMLRNELILTSEYLNIMVDIYNGIIPDKWIQLPFRKSKYREKYTINQWLKLLNNRYDVVKTWLLNSNLDIYPASLFSNIRLFLFSIINFFAKKCDVTPEYINLKFFVTKYFKGEDLFNMTLFNKEKNYENIMEMSKAHGNKEIIFIDGFSLENAFYDVRNHRLLEQQSLKTVMSYRSINLLTEEDKKTHINLCGLSIIGITYDLIEDKKNLDNEDDDTGNELKTLSIPIYDADQSNRYENIEPIGYIDMKYDQPRKEDFWISKGVKIIIDT